MLLLSFIINRIQKKQWNRNLRIKWQVSSYYLRILWKLIYLPAEIKERLCIWEVFQIRSEISGARVEKKIYMKYWHRNMHHCDLWNLITRDIKKKKPTNTNKTNYPMPQTQRSNYRVWKPASLEKTTLDDPSIIN